MLQSILSGVGQQMQAPRENASLQDILTPEQIGPVHHKFKSKYKSKYGVATSGFEIVFYRTPVPLVPAFPNKTRLDREV